jgi:hypothetical protein
LTDLAPDIPRVPSNPADLKARVESLDEDQVLELARSITSGGLLGAFEERRNPENS